MHSVGKLGLKRELLLLADPPVIQLRLGPSLRSESIKEGDDVYFECTVRSNPPVRTLQWEHNVSYRHI